jgi:hypothetical protein
MPPQRQGFLRVLMNARLQISHLARKLPCTQELSRLQNWRVSSRSVAAPIVQTLVHRGALCAITKSMQAGASVSG